MCYKPYSVTIFIVCNHLSRFLHLNNRGFISPNRRAPTKFGLLAWGVYPFHFFVSKEFVSVALSELHHINNNLGFIRRLSFLSHNLFFRYAQTLQASQPVLVWTFLTNHFARLHTHYSFFNSSFSARSSIVIAPSPSKPEPVWAPIHGDIGA